MRGEDDSPQKLVFYESRTTEGQRRIKRFCGYFQNQRNKAKLWDYSEVAIEYACYEMFKAHNIKGGPNGYTRHGKQRFYPVKIEHAWREIKAK